MNIGESKDNAGVTEETFDVKMSPNEALDTPHATFVKTIEIKPPIAPGTLRVLKTYRGTDGQYFVDIVGPSWDAVTGVQAKELAYQSGRKEFALEDPGIEGYGACGTHKGDDGAAEVTSTWRLTAGM